MSAIQVASFSPYGAQGSAFEGVLWLGFCGCSLDNIAAVWSQGESFSGLADSRVLAVSELAGNILNAAHWYMARRGFRLLVGGAPLLPFVANIAYIPYYFDKSYEFSSAFWEGREVSRADASHLLSVAQKDFITLVSNVSFLAYAVLEVLGALSGVSVCAMSTPFLTAFKVSSGALFVDEMFESEQSTE